MHTYRNHLGLYTLAFRNVHIYRLFEPAFVINWLQTENELRELSGLDPLPGLVTAPKKRTTPRKKGDYLCLFDLNRILTIYKRRFQKVEVQIAQPLREAPP